MHMEGNSWVLRFGPSIAYLWLSTAAAEVFLRKASSLAQKQAFGHACICCVSCLLLTSHLPSPGHVLGGKLLPAVTQHPPPTAVIASWRPLFPFILFLLSFALVKSTSPPAEITVQESRWGTPAQQGLGR